MSVSYVEYKPSQSVYPLNCDEFVNLLKKYQVIVVDAYAKWCTPCKVNFPKYEKLATKYYKNNKIIFCKDDIESKQTVHGRSKIKGFRQVTGVPSYFIYVNGFEKHYALGGSLESLEQKIKEFLK